MQSSFLLFVIFTLMILGYLAGRRRSLAVARMSRGPDRLHSLPAYYGFYAALWAGIPALFLLATGVFFQDWIITKLVVADLPETLRTLPPEQLGLVMNDIRNMATGNIVSTEITPAIQLAADHYVRLRDLYSTATWILVTCISVLGIIMVRARISPTLRARNRVERIVIVIMMVFSSIAILTTLGVIFSVLYESLQFFRKVPVTEFIFGTEWSPQIALRADQVGASGSFGSIPLFAGTLLISVIAMLVAVPIGLMSAIYLSDYASARFRALTKPLLEILAGIPTVVYGFFAALTMAPFIRNLGERLGMEVASESALAAGLVMGVMIIPFVSSLSDDVINAVPQSLRDGSNALGATRSETIKKVVFPAALPGIVGGVLLAMSRAIGETMIVVMAAGLSANLTANPLESVTTVTVQIVTLLTGDQEFDSPKTLAAFALGMALFAVTLVMNVIALRTVRKYREQYD
ncbi:MAG: phosphate ABC transporter permease subunit PstC [Xanthomonadales bacterium]|nr:phosphate ABC transporter permease subunit PstC [Gammaproteobacteria bacterium]NND56248.1 phosphate ABC transporter permease subunit PstC [Xanthomonadales bacterium]NNK52323.1 phosphate ABC transporter permease subunit PstC [Xanthomonadales bacterium]